MERSRIFFAIILCCYLAPIFAEDEFFIDTLELPDDNAPLNIVRQTTPCNILNTIISQTHLNRVLANDLYTYTYPLATRNILTYPTLYTPTPCDSQINWNIFYQEMPTIFPYANGIEGYLNLLNDAFLRNLDIGIIRECNINLPRTISLLKNAVVTQYRVGFMFDFWKRIKFFSLGIQLPFYAIARHYNLPLEDKQDLHTVIPRIKELFGTTNSDAPPFKQSEIYPYFVETRLGIGDTRLSFCFHVVEKDRADFVLGSKLTIPTAATFSSGFVGSDFSKCVSRKYLDIYNFVDQIIECEEEQAKKEAFDTGVQFGLATLYQMNETLLGTKLGNQRTQIALYAQPTLRVDDQVSIITNLTANWLLARRLPRFIKEVVNPTDFEDSKFEGTMTEAQCTAALTFLSNRLENDAMPAQYFVYLQPQFEFQLTAAAQIQFTDNWRFFVGYDYWRRHTECTSTISDCQHVQIPCNTLQVSSALSPQLSQQKMFLRAEYTKFKISHNFVFSLGVDLPVSSKNIGNDYTGFVRFEWEL